MRVNELEITFLFFFSTPVFEDSWYGQLEKAYVEHLLAHERTAPDQNGPYRVFLEGKLKRLRAAMAERANANDQTPSLKLWGRVKNRLSVKNKFRSIFPPDRPL